LSQDNNITINEAKVLAEAEYAEEMDKELKSIDETISGGVESEKLRLLENLKELHAKESSKLDELLSNSQQSQRNNFKRRLNQRKLMKEKEKEKEKEKNVSGKNTSSKEASSPNESSFRISSEDKQQQSELEASLEQLKNRHTIESQKLAYSLDAKKILADNALKKRIEKKNKSKGQEQKDNGFINITLLLLVY